MKNGGHANSLVVTTFGFVTKVSILNVELFDYFYVIKYGIDVVTCFGLECSYCFFGRWNPDARGGFLHKIVHLKVLILLLHICQKVCMCVIFHILHMQSLLGISTRERTLKLYLNLHVHLSLMMVLAFVFFSDKNDVKDGVRTIATSYDF